MLERVTGLIAQSWDTVSIVSFLALVLGLAINNLDMVKWAGAIFVFFASFGFVTNTNGPIPTRWLGSVITMVFIITILALRFD